MMNERDMREGAWGMERVGCGQDGDGESQIGGRKWKSKREIRIERKESKGAKEERRKGGRRAKERKRQRGQLERDGERYTE